MSFDAPAVLLVAPLIAGMVWFGAAWARRVRLHRAAQWSADTEARARAAGRFGPTTLSLAAFCGTLALAGPRWGTERVTTRARGLDLIIAVDISRSMLAEDAGGSRLAKAVREAKRLVQDLPGDRVGLVAFAGAAYTLSPLTVDGSAITLYLESLDPDIASSGGTAVAPALQSAGALLDAAPDLSDRVLVVFTDGEAHDTLPDIVAQSDRLARDGVHVIFVAEGEAAPARIPVRDDQGAFLGWQRDADSNVIGTRRRDDELTAFADAAQGSIVAADLPDQAGAIRTLLAGYKRTGGAESRSDTGRLQAWIPLLAGTLLLLGQAATRRAASLICLLLLAGGLRGAGAQIARRPRSAGARAWAARDTLGARAAYLEALSGRRAVDTAWYNAGTAALAAGDWESAQQGLSRAAGSLDPEVRFRALYNLGLLDFRLARADSANRDAHLGDAEKAYREALLLKPYHPAAKWNLELAIRRRGGGGGANSPSPQGGGGSSSPTPTPNGAGRGQARPLSTAQADEILRSIGQEELRARRDKTGRVRRAGEPDLKDW